MNEELQSEEKIQCPLCGYKFKKSESGMMCESCPLHKKSCGMIKCPNCGYDFPEPKELSISKWWKRFRKDD